MSDKAPKTPRYFEQVCALLEEHAKNFLIVAATMDKKIYAHTDSWQSAKGMCDYVAKKIDHYWDIQNMNDNPPPEDDEQWQ